MTFATGGLPSQLYRVTRSSDPLTFTDWIYLDRSKPGRWDDPHRQYRVLYTASSVIGALIEVLQDLRPRAQSEAIEDSVVDDARLGRSSTEFSEAVVQYLRNRRLTELLPSNADDEVVVVAKPPSRTRIERGLRLRRRLKVGDFNGSDYVLPGKISRIIFEADDERYTGIECESAELPGATCYTLFETGYLTGITRATLARGRTRDACIDQVDTVWKVMVSGHAG